MAKILVCDTECNSLDTENGVIQELAWIIWDSEKKRAIKAQSALIRWDKEYETTVEAIRINGLKREYTEKFGISPGMIFNPFLNDLAQVEYICGHNILGYDLPMLISNLERFKDSYSVLIKKVPVIDTMLDCPFPEGMRISSLKYLALDHNYILMNAHNALSDVMACAHLLGYYDFETILQISKTPVVKMQSKVEFTDIERREKLKGQRFYWNKEQKLWERKIRQWYVSGVQLELGFNVSMQKEF